MLCDLRDAPDTGGYPWLEVRECDELTVVTAGAAANSVLVSAAGATVALLLALPVAALAARYPGRGADAVERVAYAGYALPGLVVGLAFVFFASRYAAARKTRSIGRNDGRATCWRRTFTWCRSTAISTSFEASRVAVPAKSPNRLRSSAYRIDRTTGPRSYRWPGR